MNKQTFTLTILVITILMITCGVAYKIKNKSVLQQQTGNWQWEDDWSEVPEINEDPEVEIEHDVQIYAETYSSAVEASTKYDMPILIVFSADWCSWCTKMKNDTLTDTNVKKEMMNYVFVEIDTDENKDIAKKFNIKSLPSCTIVNEGKIKTSSGYKKPDDFISWLK